MKNKHLILIVIIVASALAILFLGTRGISNRIFTKLEQEEMIRSVEMVKNILAAEVQQIKTIAGDYSGWDDAYAFVQNGNRTFIQTNFENVTYEKLRLNLIIYLNRAGHIVYARSYDYHNKREIPLSPALSPYLQPGEPLSTHLSPEKDLSGILQLPEGLMFVASQPVLTSSYKGPIMGTLVIGRYLDAAETKRLSELTKLDLQVIPAAEIAKNAALQSIHQHLAGNDAAYVAALDTKLISAMTLIRDIYGKDAGLLRVLEPRHALETSKEATSLFYQLYCATTGIFIIIFSLLARKLILARRTDIQTSKELKDREEQYRSLFDNALTGNFVATLDCHVVLCNMAFAGIMGYDSVEEVLSATSIDFFPCEQDKKNCHSLLKQVRQVAFMEFAMKRKDGAPITCLGNIEGIFDNDGNLVNVRGYLLDITERKRDTEKIQQMNEQLAQLVKEISITNSELESRVIERTADLKKSHEEMRKISFQLIWAEERERERIAADLHDHVGQSLLLAKMKLDALTNEVLIGQSSSFAKEASTLVASTLQDIRTLTVRIRPPILDTANIETALQWLCSSMNSDYSLEIDFLNDGKPKPLAAEERYALYQIARELLLNVVKHGETGKAKLSLRVDANTLVIQVIDNGVGFNNADVQMQQSSGDAYGLYIVQQRIEQIGGTFSIDSVPGRGTTVTVMVPLKETAPGGNSHENVSIAC